MLVRDFAVLAATIAGYAPAIIRRSAGLPETCLHTYWVAARSRLNRWGPPLRRLQVLQGSGLLAQMVQWDDLRLLEEILASEIVTRVWCATLDGIDERLGLQEYGPIGRSTHLGHLEARQRVLQLVMAGHREGPTRLWLLNPMRLQTEHWTDLLLSCFPSVELAAPYCYDEQRLRDYAAARGTPRRGLSSAPLLVALGDAWFAESRQPLGANDDLHEQVRRSIVGCLTAPLFSGSGAWEGSWPDRLEATTDDILVELDRWLGIPVPIPGRPDRGRF